MAAKAITIYTPSDTAPHIYAEDDAQLHRALMGMSGITLADDELALTIVSDNTVRLSSGIYSMQGYLLAVQGGTTADLTVDSGAAGAYRHDLVIAEFVRGGGDTADTFQFRVLKGTAAGSAAAAVDPAITQGDLITGTGGGTRQEIVYRLYIEGTSIARAERVAEYIGSYESHLDEEPTIGSLRPVMSGGTAQMIQDNMPRVFSVQIPLADWSSTTPYEYSYYDATLETQSHGFEASAFFTDATSASRPRSPIQVSVLNGRIRFRTDYMPRGQLNVTIIVQKTNGAGNHICIGGGAGGGTYETGYMTVADTLTGVTENVNECVKNGQDAMAALDITFNSTEVTSFATLPEYFRPFFPEKSYARAWNASGTEISPVEVTLLENGVLSIPATTCKRILFTALYKSYTIGSTTMTLSTGSSYSGTVTETVNEITRDLGAGTSVGNFACSFVPAIDWRTPILYVPAGWGTTLQSRQTLTMTYTTDGTNWQESTIDYYPNSEFGAYITKGVTSPLSILGMTLSWNLPVDSAQPPQ